MKWDFLHFDTSSSYCIYTEMFELFSIKGIRGVSKIKDGYNPATWMLEVTAAAQEAALGVNFTYVYKNSELYQYVHLSTVSKDDNFLLEFKLINVECFRTNKALIKELSSPPPDSKDLYFPTPYSQSIYTQCMACLWKQHWSYWRNPLYTAVKLFFTTFISLMFGTIFWDLGSKR